MEENNNAVNAGDAAEAGIREKNEECMENSEQTETVSGEQCEETAPEINTDRTDCGEESSARGEIDCKIEKFFEKYPSLISKSEMIREYLKNNPKITEENYALEIAAMHVLAEAEKRDTENRAYEEYLEKLDSIKVPVTIGNGGGLTPKITDRPKTIEEANRLALKIFRCE